LQGRLPERRFYERLNPILHGPRFGNRGMSPASQSNQFSWRGGYQVPVRRQH